MGTDGAAAKRLVVREGRVRGEGRGGEERGREGRRGGGGLARNEVHDL